VEEDVARPSEARPRVPWLRRALAAAAAAGLGAWLGRHVPGAPPIPPALAACVAGLLVAALPRAGWLAGTAVMAGSVAVNGHAGAALVLAAAGLVPVALSPRDGPAWPLAAAAPALAALHLATAWPALAGLSGRAHRRVALAAAGWLWIVLSTTKGIAWPTLSAGMLAGAGVWTLAAFTLPWTRSARWPALESVRIALWAIALGIGTAVAEHLDGPTLEGVPLLGACAGALVAVVTRWLMSRLRGHQIGGRSRADRVASP
jgi:hypothetical protein